MGKCQINFVFSIEDKVNVKDIEIPGRVDALCWDLHGEQYRVVYWNNGERKSAWMYSWELELAKEKQG